MSVESHDRNTAESLRLDTERRENQTRQRNSYSLLSPSLMRDLVSDRDARRAELTRKINAMSEAELDAIAAHRHRRIAGEYDIFRFSLVNDQMQEPSQRRYEMIQSVESPSEAATKESVSVSSPLPVNGRHENEISIYRKMGNPIEAAEQLGISLYKSAMLGIGTKEAGTVVALTCITEGISPIEFVKRYHIIENKPSMKADYMVAEFQRLGGKIKIVQRDSEGAAADFVWAGETQRFAIDWKIIQQESFCWKKGGKELTPRYATPFSRTQQLWARLVSDSIRAICPQVNSGSYTPEETVDYLGNESEIIDASFTRTEEPKEESKKDTKPVAPTSPAPSNREPLRENGGVSAIMHEQAARAAELVVPGYSNMTDITVSGVTREQLTEAASLKNILGWNSEKWKSLISNPKLGGVESMKLMTLESADRLLAYLRREVAKMPKNMTDTTASMRGELDRWADGELAPNGMKAANAKN